jgi:hypothetical protein
MYKNFKAGWRKRMKLEIFETVIGYGVDNRGLILGRGSDLHHITVTQAVIFILLHKIGIFLRR